MTTRCVEPAEAKEGLHKYLVWVDKDDELLFPHVDSCIAIAFILHSGAMIGGHVGMQMPDAQTLDPYGNAMHICNEMISLGGAAQVSKVILVGDGNWESDPIKNLDVVKALKETIKCRDVLFVDTGAYGGGVDFSINPRRQMIFIQQCRDPKTLLLQRPYTTIIGDQIKRLP